MSTISSGDTIKEFLESSILSKKEINQVYDYINSGQRDAAKQYLDLTTMEFKQRNEAKKLIDEWPKNIWLTLDKIDPKNKKDIEEHNRWKKFDDGTFEMIPEFPEQAPRDIATDLQKKVRLLNGGNNLLEFIKDLPVTKQNKMAMYQYIEKRHPERIPPFCEFLGLGDDTVKSMETYIELFQENGGPELFIKAKDYEVELDAIELENQLNPSEELKATKEEIQIRK